MVLVDNTVLSNFAKVNKLDLIKRSFDRVYITEQVLEEFKLGVKRGVLPDVNLDFEVLKLKDEEIELYNALRVKLGKGEASCLSIAKHRNMEFLTDDSDARKTANILGVPVSGTIGILVRCVEEGNNYQRQG
jgi:predicted nucleic acid-binding protein